MIKEKNMQRLASAVLVGLFFAGALLTRPTAQAPERPSLFLSAISADVISFSQAVAAHGVPAGLILSASTRNLPHSPPTRRPDPRDADLETVFERFSATNPGYVAERVDEVVLIRNQNLPTEVRQLLARVHPGFEFRDITAGTAIFKVGDLLARGDSQTGYAGSEGGKGCPLRVPIEFTAPAPSTLDLLNAITKQSKLVWLMLYDLYSPINKLQLGYMCPDGSYYRFTVRGW